MDLEEALEIKEDGTFECKSCAYTTTRKRYKITTEFIHQASTNAKVRDVRLRRRRRATCKSTRKSSTKVCGSIATFVIIRWPIGKI